MSQETSQWLNTKTLIGFTESRGNAWHYREEEQGDESNHYVGAVPLEDVERRLFNWEAVEVPLPAIPMSEITTEGVDSYKIKDPTRKVIARPRGALSEDDPGGIFGIFKTGYTVHQYNPWLLENVATILDDELQIGSAGLLKEGAVAFVQVEMPEGFTTPEGVEFRPHLLAATGMDGSLSSTYKRCVQIAVCDNTMEAALVEGGKNSQRLRIRHSKKSMGRITEVREALAIVHDIADEFSAQVAQLCNVAVSEGDFAKFLDEIAAVPEDDGYGKTISLKKRAAIEKLYTEDERCAPWTGTAFGVLQTMNTYQHHGTMVMGDGSRFERNQINAIRGATGKSDIDTLKVLSGLGVGRGE